MAHKLNEIIGAKVRMHREKNCLSMRDLCLKLKGSPISEQQFWLYEQGKSRWPADLLLEVSKILGVKISSLYGEGYDFNL